MEYGIKRSYCWVTSMVSKKIFSHLGTAFNNRKKNNVGLVSLLNAMYYEMYGDRFQCMFLVSCFYRTQLKQKQLDMKQLISSNQDNKEDSEQTLFEGDRYHDLISTIDLTFKRAIISTYTSFCVLGEPLVSAMQINVLVDRFKREMNVHHFMMKKILGIDKKERLIRNKHLVDTGYYDRMIFYNFLTLTRLRNPQSCINYAIVSAAALYSKGCGDNIQRRFTYSGTSASVKTFLKRVRPYGDKMLEYVSSELYKTKTTVATLDNNQKGHPHKYQRFGSSNKFVKVTARYFRQFCPHNNNYNEITKQCKITYVNQSIPSPDGILPFENIYNNEVCSYTVMKDAILSDTIRTNRIVPKIDFSGKRVESYAKLVDICDEIQNGVRSFLTGYHRSSKEYKYWKNMPPEYCTIERDSIVLLMNSLKTTSIAKCCSFQKDTVLTWNPASKEATKLIIPPVSLRDEIKTDGFGMAVIELLCLVGILHEEKVSTTYTKWELDRDWDKRRMFLCIDGLSLDRHRHFQKKLANVKLSFTNAFKQSLIFQKALTRVTEINGPLHMAFHMLQTVYTVYGTMLKWGQTIVDWKRLTASKVCDSFDLCRQLLFLMLEEMDRLAWDMFLYEKMNMLQLKKQTIENENDFLFVLADDYLTYLKHSACDTNDERRKYMFFFILMARKFRQFWFAMRRGDRVMQEYLTTEWIGIFHLLKKHNYVEICLSAIETEYHKISYDELQSIRINAAVRYRNGNDNKGDPFPLHVLDEVMENINGWTKRLLLGPDEQSWKLHSPNLMCAHRSNNFEIDAFTKHRLDLSEEPKRKLYTSNSTKTTEPRKTVERQRIYEWCVLMFNKEQTRRINEKDGFYCIKQLNTHLKNRPNSADSNSKPDPLECCIDDIFNNNDIGDETYTNITMVPTDSSNDDVIDDVIDDEAIEDNDEEGQEVRRGKINRLSIIDIFSHAKSELIKVNVSQVRMNKKKRLERSDQFYRDIYNSILNDDDEFDNDINDIINTTVANKPWYRSTYNSLL